MIAALLAAIITILISPFAYHILGTYAITTNKKKWPIGYTDFLGDLIFLPLFNALILLLGIQTIPTASILISVGVGLVITTTFVLWRKNIALHNDYTRPRKGLFNFIGWYHAGYMLIQATFLTYGLILYYNKWIIYVPFILYLIPLTMRYIELWQQKNIA